MNPYQTRPLLALCAMLALGSGIGGAQAARFNLVSPQVITVEGMIELGDCERWEAALKPTVTTAKSTKSSVAKGEKFAVKGQVKAAGSGVNGLKVTLYKVKSSGLSKIASKTTATLKGKAGSFKFKGLTQKRTSRYQVKSVANATYAASKSKVVKVTT